MWKDKARGGTLHLLLRHTPKKRRKRRGLKERRGRIPHRVDISERPAVVDGRSRFGDWEADTVIGKGRAGALVTLAERKSRLLLARPVRRATKTETAAALKDMLGSLGALVKTITCDNGREFPDHRAVAEAAGSDSCFARPCHSWERGLSEHSNGLLRQHFPKSMPFHAITRSQVDRAVDRINRRPRKCLGFQTPLEVLQKAFDAGEIDQTTGVALLG